MKTLTRRRFAALSALSVLAVAAFAAPSPAMAEPTVGSPAPAFTGVDTKGQKVNLADYRGKTVILEWTNHDCPFVVKHYSSGNMQMTQKKATEDGVVWLSVISSAPGEQGNVSGPQADALTQSRNAGPSAVLLDPSGEIGRKYAARTTPHMFIIDPKGTLAYHGAIDSIKSTDVTDIPKAQNYVLNALAQMKAGEPVKPQGTRPYGCSVKYGS
ncbi:MAG TPA: thioredoxin family protein [Rhodospirillaceae bacterium]|nr:thioredoxin family protein [Rhodospirillaceae bacterium]